MHTNRPATLLCAAALTIGIATPGESQSATSYEVVAYEDISRKAMGNRTLSDFSLSELRDLPTNKRVRVNAVVPDLTREAQVRPTVEAIVDELTTADPDVDEIALLLYSSYEQEEAGGAYDVARATWSTNGDLGGITPEIASSNRRTEYSISVKVASDLEAYLQAKRSETPRQGLSEAKRKEIFRALVKAEDRATSEAQRHYPVMCVGVAEVRANQERHTELRDSLDAVYTDSIKERYGISEATVDSIDTEALRERWPLPEQAPVPGCP